MSEFSIAGCTVCVKKSFKAVSERSAVFVKLVEAGGEEKRLKNTESNAHLVYRRKQEFFVLQHQ